MKLRCFLSIPASLSFSFYFARPLFHSLSSLLPFFFGHLLSGLSLWVLSILHLRLSRPYTFWSNRVPTFFFPTRVRVINPCLSTSRTCHFPPCPPTNRRITNIQPSLKSSSTANSSVDWISSEKLSNQVNGMRCMTLEREREAAASIQLEVWKQAGSREKKEWRMGYSSGVREARIPFLLGFVRRSSW